jgi:hypothetical protein
MAFFIIAVFHLLHFQMRKFFQMLRIFLMMSSVAFLLAKKKKKKEKKKR